MTNPKAATEAIDFIFRLLADFAARRSMIQPSLISYVIEIVHLTYLIYMIMFFFMVVVQLIQDLGFST